MFSQGKKIIFFILAVLVLASLFHTAITNVQFTNNKAHISKIYCALFGSQKNFQTPVIFIPGTKGSTLAQENDGVWLTSSQLLGDTTPLIFEKNDGFIGVDGILTRLTLIPGIISYAPYQYISAQLACAPESYFFYYDWRKNPADHVALLSALVDRVHIETGKKPSIIAHSMGGLIAHYYLKENSAKINKVVYISVPFAPGLSFLEDINQGSRVGLNKTILSKEALFSQPGSFALLPHAGDKLYKEQSLFDASVWQENHLSVFQNGGVLEEDFTQVLSGIESFHQGLDMPVQMPNQFLIVAGDCIPTLHSINNDGTKNFKPGDGRVVADGSYPVEFADLSTQMFRACVTHDKQMNDEALVGKVFEFLSSPDTQ